MPHSEHHALRGPLAHALSRRLEGSTMATIRDVAKLASCSTATVSRYVSGKSLRPDAERRVRAAIEALAFSPNVVARNLKLKKSMILGMVIPDITNAFFPEVVGGVEDVGRASGY